MILLKNNNEAIERMRRASILASENFVKIGRRNISKPAYEYLLQCGTTFKKIAKS
jgi:hypothetical protein